MSHQTDTLTQPIPMPRQTHLLRRGSRYYLNVKVPKDLHRIIKKEIIRKALNTSDPHEAARKVRLESLRVHADFENERAKLRTRNAPPKQLSTISTDDAYNLVFRYFKALEQISEHWWEGEASKLDEQQIGDALDALRIDEVVLTGGNQNYQQEDGSHFLDLFLREQRTACPTDSTAYETLRPLFRRAQLENTRRTMDRIEKHTVNVHDPLFRDVFTHTELIRNGSAKSATVGDLLRRFAQAQRTANLSAGTQMTYEIPARILREVLGEHAALADITP